MVTTLRHSDHYPITTMTQVNKENNFLGDHVLTKMRRKIKTMKDATYCQVDSAKNKN